MELNLKNPIIFFDIESTGLNVSSDRIIEISCIKIAPNGDQEIKTRRINPAPVKVSPEAFAVHGISNEDLANEPKFKQIAQSLANWMEGCDFGGYNCLKFDIPILAEEFIRAGIDFDFRKRNVIDVQNIFHKMEQRTLVAAYKFYCQKDLTLAHSAEADTLATYEVLKSQLDRYSNVLENDVKMLSDFSSRSKLLDYAGRIVLNDKNIPVFNFGKHKGKPVDQVFLQEPSYYAWIQDGDFTLDTKKVATELYLKSRSLK